MFSLFFFVKKSIEELDKKNYPYEEINTILYEKFKTMFSYSPDEFLSFELLMWIRLIAPPSLCNVLFETGCYLYSRWYIHCRITLGELFSSSLL